MRGLSKFHVCCAKVDIVGLWHGKIASNLTHVVRRCRVFCASLLPRSNLVSSSDFSCDEYHSVHVI